MDQFRYGQQNYVKDLISTFHEDMESLSKALNQLFERCSELQQILDSETEKTYASMEVAPSSSHTQAMNTIIKGLLQGRLMHHLIKGHWLKLKS